MARWRWFLRPDEPVDMVGPATIYTRPSWVEERTSELPPVPPKPAPPAPRRRP